MLKHSSEDTIFVVAAGNSGKAFPFYPAAWPQVVSVSASSESLDDYRSSGGKASYSNDADVMMPGWFDDGTADGVEGTSFAAPRLSFLLAAYLTGQQANTCQQNVSPAMISSPFLYSGSWNNDAIEIAANKSGCLVLNDYLP